MGPKYEFKDETMNFDGCVLHRIKRLSDGKLGGWIEKEENLSQEGNCWVDDEAMVYGEARVYGNAQVYDKAGVHDNVKVYDNAKVYGDVYISDNAKIYGDAEVYGDASIYDNAQVYDTAKVFGYTYVFGNASVYDRAEVYGSAKVYDDAEIHGKIRICMGEYTEEYYDVEESLEEVILDLQYFINIVNDSNKITTQTEYDSIDEFFKEPIKNDVKLDTLIICTVDTKIPLIKLEKVEIDNETKFKFIVDITNEDGDDCTFKSIIKSQDQLDQNIQMTIDILKNYHEFSKYVDDLENCL